MRCCFRNMLQGFFRRVLPFLLIILVIIVCGGCPSPGTSGGDEAGDGEDNPGEPPPPTSDEPLYEETNSAIAAAMDAVNQNLATLGLAGAMQAAADAIAGYDCVSSVSCAIQETGNDQDDGDPYLITTFTNGIVYQMHVIHTDLGDLDPLLPEPETLLSETLSTESTPTLARTPVPLVQSRAIGVCDNTQALFLDLPEFNADVARWVGFFEDVGYNCVYKTDWRVEDYQNLDAYGLVYINSHGELLGYYDESFYKFDVPQRRNTTDDLEYIKNGDFRDISVMLTSRVYVEEYEDPYVKEDIEYGVTERYIRKYSGTFPEHSIFFADACFSATPIKVIFTKPLVDTLLAMGVGTVLGWDWKVEIDYATRAGNFVVGQMMADFDGLNYIGFSGPPIRPYSLLDAFTALHHKAWQYDSKRTELMLYGEIEPILRPSIQQVIVDVDIEQETEELSILGNFGERAGSILLCQDAANPDGGSEMSWTEWDEDRVTVTSGAEDCGYVVARINGVHGNAHPLSRWEFTDMEVTGTQPGGAGPDISLTMDASWRAEIVDERGLVTDGTTVPAVGWADPIAMASRAATLLSLESNTDYEFTGTFEDDRYIYEYPEGMNEGNISVFWDGGEEMFLGTVTMQPDTGSAMFMINFIKYAQVMKTDKSVPGAEPKLEQILVPIGLYFEAEMNKAGKISAGEQAMPYSFSWPDTEPDFPPREETAR